MDYYLKATGPATLNEALLAAGIMAQVLATESNPGGLQLMHDAHLDVIGTITKPTGSMIEVDGESQPELAVVSGFHANLRATLTLAQVALLPIIPAPSTPTRVWG